MKSAQVPGPSRSAPVLHLQRWHVYLAAIATCAASFMGCNLVLGNESGRHQPHEAGAGSSSVSSGGKSGSGNSSNQGGKASTAGQSSAGGAQSGGSSNPGAEGGTSGTDNPLGEPTCTPECGPNAECEWQGDVAGCSCVPGFVDFEGKCTDVDECSVDNGGCDMTASCINLPGSRQCDCQAGYELDPENDARCVSSCETAGCDPHATCSVQGDAVQCTCVAPYVGDGKTCSFDESCEAKGCSENARCDPEQSNQCVCALGFEGDGQTCTNIDDCSPDACKNGGKCQDGIGGFSCDCSGTGFKGKTCEENIDDCLTGTCGNGTCQDGLKSYTCQCNAGYTGKNCETNVDECAAKPCLNGGTCTDGVADYKCTCPAAFGGKNCEIKVSGCVAPSPCVRGTCTDQPNGGYKCTCPAGYDGVNCENNINDCGPTNPCLNGGKCTDKVNGFTCTCPAGWGGARCDTGSCANLTTCAASAPCRVPPTAKKRALCYPTKCVTMVNASRPGGICLAEGATGSGAAVLVAGHNPDLNPIDSSNWNNRARYFAYIDNSTHGSYGCIFPSPMDAGTPLVIPLGELRTKTSGFGQSSSWPSDKCKR